MEKKKNVLLCSVLAICITIGLILGISSSKETINNANSSTINNEVTVSTTEPVKESNYLTKIMWADLNNYCCAVEVLDFNGDIIEAGVYHFYPDLVSGIENKNIPIVWDVYISENLYSNILELKDEEFVDSVGGYGNYGWTIELKKNQYVYIKYNSVINNQPTGILVIEKQS